MSKVEHNGIYYDPHNEIVCDKLRLKEIIEENETIKNHVADLESKLSLTEKALELACEFNATTTCNGQCQDCLHKEICDNIPKIDFRPMYADYFKKQAKEMMKSE